MSPLTKTAKIVTILLALLVLLAAVLGSWLWKKYSSEQTYPVLLEEMEHAAVTLKKDRVAEGRDCVVTVLPEHGYRVAFVWLDNGNKTIPMTEKKEHEYHGTMPSSHASVRTMIVPDGIYGVHVICNSEQAKVRMEPDTGKPGDTMTLTVTIPDDVRVRGIRSEPDTVMFRTVRGSGVYTFAMPEEDVELTVSMGKKLFSDVENAWYEYYVYEAVSKGYMTGTVEGLFEPNLFVTRAQTVQTLYAMAGSPDVQGKNHYSDVEDGRWYTRAIIWAAENSVLGGYEDGTFRPDEHIVREQIVTAFYHYVTNVLEENAAERSPLSEFTDAGQISQYAKAPVQWAVARGILSGVTDTVLQPSGPVARSQLAAMLLALKDETPGIQLEDVPAVSSEETGT